MTAAGPRWPYLAALLLCLVAWMVRFAAAQSTAEVSFAADPEAKEISQLVSEKRWPDVVEAAHHLIGSHPGDAAAFYWLGTAQLQLHNGVDAVRALRSAQKLGLDTPLLHESLGLAYYDLHQFTLFAQQMREVGEKDPTDFRPDYYLGLYRLTIKSDAAGALTYFDRATQLQPDDWKSLYEDGNCLEKLTRFAEAKSYYQRAISSLEAGHQPFGWPYQGMARLLVESDPHQALEFAARAVQAEPNEYSNHLIVAKVYQRLDRPAEAIREAQAATTLSPSDASAHYLLFILLRDSGERRSAEAELETLKKINEVYGPE
jgi:tetratricopeptide (TPR) repeat protein